jgi:hypothetical protein
MRFALPLSQGLSLLTWAVGGVSADTTCSAAGTVIAPLEGPETLETLTADLDLTPDCHVFGGGRDEDIPCQVEQGATVKFWFTCDDAEDDRISGKCNSQEWFGENAQLRFWDKSEKELDVSLTTHIWDGDEYPCWKLTLISGFDVWIGDLTRFGRVQIKWRGAKPTVGERIHLHTNINELKPLQTKCTGDVDGAGQGASSLVVGTTTRTTSTSTTLTTTTTMCQWSLKPCGQCLTTPVEYCPANPATDSAMLGPISGASLETPTLDTSAFSRRLRQRGCVAAASLYPEIVGVCRDDDDELCTDQLVMVESGMKLKITVKITNHCIDAEEPPNPMRASVNLLAVRELILEAEAGGKLENPKLVKVYPDAGNLGGESKTSLANFTAVVILNKEAPEVNGPVEISARLKDRSVSIDEGQCDAESGCKCAQEEGTAWGSTAITVWLTTSTATSTISTTSSTSQTQTSTVTSTRTSTTVTSTSTTWTTSTLTSTTQTSTVTTSTSLTTTTRPCACFEMCCEDKPVQGVHLPVHPNVCPEWWQGKMTGRAQGANSSGSLMLEESLKMKRSNKVDCVGCDAAASSAQASSPPDRMFFQKWSSSDMRSETTKARPWAAMVAFLAMGVAVMAVVRRPAVMLGDAREERDEGVMDQLVQRERSIDGCL